MDRPRLLHREHGERVDFSIAEIVERAQHKNLTKSMIVRPGVRAPTAQQRCRQACKSGTVSDACRNLVWPPEPLFLGEPVASRPSLREIPATARGDPGRIPSRAGPVPRVVQSKTPEPCRGSNSEPSRAWKGILGQRGYGRLPQTAQGALVTSRAFWDTKLFIYLIEDAGDRYPSSTEPIQADEG